MTTSTSTASGRSSLSWARWHRSVRARWMGLGIAALAVLGLAFAGSAEAQIAQPRPVIERLEPTSGPVGTTVQMIGRHFRPDQTVLLGTTPLTVGSRLPNRWTLTIPEGATSGDLEVRLADGTTSRGPSFRVVAASAAPVIASLEPSHGAVGSEVRILGDNFSPRLAENIVMLGALPVVVRAATPTDLLVIVPPGAATATFRVRVSGAPEVTGPSFTVEEGLRITSFEPRVISPGGRITIHGSGFPARPQGLRAFVGDRALRVVSTSADTIVADVPANGATGLLLVDVRGAGRTYSTENLSVRPAPVIARLEPESGVIGATVVVRGQNYGTDVRDVRVLFGEAVGTVCAVTADSVQVEVPTGAASGPISVAVGGLPPVASAASFAVLVPASIRGFEPLSGPVGAEVTIRGEGFSTRASDVRVTLSGVAATVLESTGTTLRVRIPQAGSGPLEVQIANAGTVRSQQPFVITHPPVIARLEPARGPIGTVVRLQGAGFGSNPAVAEVTIGGRRMEIRSYSDTQIEAVVPAFATTSPISVNVRLQGAGLTSTSFQVISEFAVSALEPATGYPGQTLTVRGRGFFEGQATATFTGSRAAAVSRWGSPEELHVVIPEDAQTGPITIASGDGRSATLDFTRADAPAGLGITELVPACLQPRCELVIRGYGFGTRAGDVTITVYGQRVRPRRVRPFEIVLPLPPRPGQGPIHIALRGGAAIDSEAIIVAPPLTR